MNHVGKIARIKCSEFTQENLPTGVKPAVDGSIFLCTDIDPAYPVLGSLHHYKKPVLASSIGIVVSHHARPNSFQSGPVWKDYEILSVYIDGDVYKCFELSLDFITA